MYIYQTYTILWVYIHSFLLFLKRYCGMEQLNKLKKIILVPYFN